MKKKEYAVYRIRNLVNGKAYIGSSIHVRRRKIDHFSRLKLGTHRNVRLQRAYKKYGVEAFVFEILETVEDIKQVVAREQFWIDKLACGYNIRLIAESNIGMKHAPEFGARIAATKTGTKRPPLSEEWKRRIGESTKLALADASVREKMSKHRLGKKHTLESRQKMSDRLSGRKFSDEWRRKLSEAQKRRSAMLGKEEMTRLAHLAAAGRTRCKNGRFLPKEAAQNDGDTRADRSVQ